MYATRRLEKRNPSGALGVLKDGDYINDALINIVKK